MRVARPPPLQRGQAHGDEHGDEQDEQAAADTTVGATARQPAGKCAGTWPLLPPMPLERVDSDLCPLCPRHHQLEPPARTSISRTNDDEEVLQECARMWSSSESRLY